MQSKYKIWVDTRKATCSGTGKQTTCTEMKDTKENKARPEFLDAVATPGGKIKIPQEFLKSAKSIAGRAGFGGNPWTLGK
jgi:hypothetical protein